MTDKVELEKAQQRQLNQTAYRVLKEEIRQRYPRGRFVAISGGRIVADAEDIKALDPLLQAQGLYPPDVLVVQAGVDYPDFAIILSSLPRA